MSSTPLAWTAAHVCWNLTISSSRTARRLAAMPRPSSRAAIASTAACKRAGSRRLAAAAAALTCATLLAGGGSPGTT